MYWVPGNHESFRWVPRVQHALWLAAWFPRHCHPSLLHSETFPGVLKQGVLEPSRVALPGAGARPAPGQYIMFCFTRNGLLNKNMYGQSTKVVEIKSNFFRSLLSKKIIYCYAGVKVFQFINASCSGFCLNFLFDS